MAPSGTRGFVVAGTVVLTLHLFVGALPVGPAERAWVSDVFQIVVASAATYASVRAVLASAGVARAFWVQVRAGNGFCSVSQPALPYRLASATSATRTDS